MKLVLGLLLVVSGNVFAFGGGPRGGHGPDEGMRAAMDACFTELGLTKPERGVRPSDEERQKMETCLASKGFEKKERPVRKRNSDTQSDE